MNNYPEFVEVNNKRFKINTDFRYAIKCNQIAQDESIGDYERVLGILVTLFGDNSIDDINDINKLFELAVLYLSCGKGLNNKEEPDMDYIQDMDYIETSFQSDYGISLEDENIHWWKFNNLMNGLSNSELGNCCILNRIRNLRNYDVSTIKDDKERQKVIDAKKEVELDRNKKENHLTKEQEESINKINQIVGI